jgi:hypothetical protein
MLNFFKPTKDKIKIFFLFLIANFVISFIFSYATAFAVRNIGENIQYLRAVNFFSEVLLLLIISYFVLAVIKKKLFVARYWIEFIEILAVIFLTEKISSIISNAVFSEFFSKADFLNFALVFGLIFKILLYYIMICSIDLITKRNAPRNII